MLTNRSLSRPAHLLVALFGAMALTFLIAGSARAAVSPDKAFGKAGMATWQAIGPSIANSWDQGRLLQDGGVAFLGSRTVKTTRVPLLTVLGAGGKLDSKLGPNRRIDYPRFARRAFAHSYGVSAIERQSDGKLLLASAALIPSTNASRRCKCEKFQTGWALLRLTRAGKRDRTFGRDGVVLINGKSSPVRREAITLAAPDKIVLDRRGGILLYGPSPSQDTGPALLRLRKNGALDRSFGLVTESGAVISRAQGAPPMYMELTSSGQIVTVGIERKYPADGKSSYSIRAVIHRYSMRGKLLKLRGPNSGRTVIALPGVLGPCTSKCIDDGPSDTIRPDVLPSGAVLIAGGAGWKGAENLTSVTPRGELDTSLGGDGHITAPVPIFGSATILAASARSNGEVWSATLFTTAEGQEVRLVRFDRRGNLIRPSADSTGDLIASPSECGSYVAFGFSGSSLLSHSSCGPPVPKRTTFDVRRWSVTY